jgi:hypothetical protein
VLSRITNAASLAEAVLDVVQRSADREHADERCDD